jgi:hypothetical protein
MNDNWDSPEQVEKDYDDINTILVAQLGKYEDRYWALVDEANKYKRHIKRLQWSVGLLCVVLFYTISRELSVPTLCVQ